MQGRAPQEEFSAQQGKVTCAITCSKGRTTVFKNATVNMASVMGFRRRRDFQRALQTRRTARGKPRGLGTHNQGLRKVAHSLCEETIKRRSVLLSEHSQRQPLGKGLGRDGV